MFGELDYGSLQVGQQVQYEEKYHLAGIVTILEIEHGKHGEDWLGYKVRLDKKIFGSMPEGTVFTCGYNKNYPHYRGHKFKEVGSPTDYVVLNAKK
jgi:hypothetical protein